MITSLPLRREMETKNRAKSIPSKYVTLKQLQELRLKERQEKEEKPRWQEKEEKPRWQKKEEERPRELEEEGEARQGIDEKAKSGNSPRNSRSNASARRKQRRNDSGRRISFPSPNSEVDGVVEAVGGSNRNPQTTNCSREKQAATDRTENEDDGTAKDSGAVSGSEIALEPSPESLIGGVNGRGRRASRPKRYLQPARVIGGGPERTVQIERRFGDLRINVRDEKPAAAAERRVAAGRRGGGLGMAGRRGRWVTPAGSGMVWVRKTTSS